jgi:hypothetical protein
METHVLTWIAEKLHGLMCDFEHYSRHRSLGEEALDLVAPVRAGMSNERSCCSTGFGSWRALMESSLRCSLPLAYDLNWAQSRRAGLEDLDLRLESARLEIVVQSRCTLRFCALCLDFERDCGLMHEH